MVTTASLIKTDTRVAALREVIDGLITYDTASGTYAARTSAQEGAEATALTGWRRRTFAELRRAKLISPASDRGLSTMELTRLVGKATAAEWGLTSPSDVG